MSEYAASIKKPEWKRAKLLGSGWRITALRVHAIGFTVLEAAEQAARDVMGTNIGLIAKAIRI